MTDGLTARLAGLQFTGRRFRWEPGLYIVTLGGINGGAETVADSVPGRVGAHDSGNRRETARNFPVTGFAFERSERLLQLRLDQLGAVLAEDDARTEFSWQIGAEMRWATVRRSRYTEPTRRRDPRFADFAFTLRAPDQRIYGVTTVSDWGSSVDVVHYGGYPAPVLIEVRGAASGYTITGPRGKVVQVTRPIASGAPHTYDGDTGALTVGGVPQVTGVGRSDAINIPYGRHRLTVNNGCEIRVTFAPTWAP